MARFSATEHLKAGLLRGVGLGVGMLTTGLVAAALAMNVFTAGQTISASQINQNFAIAAPEGLIAAFNLANCPDGWAPADGTNGTPDLRGLFLRGRNNVGTGSRVDSYQDPAGDRAAGALQLDAFQGHRHDVSIDVGRSTGIAAPGGSGADGPNGTVTILDPITDGTNGAPRTANETRSRNIAVTYCVRKNS